MTSDSGVATAALKGCLEVCRRCQTVVETLAITDRGRSAYGAVGPHVRHCVDHFLAFFSGLSAGRVDYDARCRDREVEQDPGRALEILDLIGVRLESLAGADPERPLQVVQLACPEAAPSTVASSLDRELLFLSSHTIHHLALIVELATARGVDLPRSIGVAFSTARYRERGDEGRT